MTSCMKNYKTVVINNSNSIKIFFFLFTVSGMGKFQWSSGKGEIVLKNPDNICVFSAWQCHQGSYSYTDVNTY